MPTLLEGKSLKGKDLLRDHDCYFYILMVYEIDAQIQFEITLFAAINKCMITKERK